jgi:hypothetical protein
MKEKYEKVTNISSSLLTSWQHPSRVQASVKFKLSLIQGKLVSGVRFGGN